jgi:steroid delta-isomerase-like uncharacterized protein
MKKYLLLLIVFSFFAGASCQQKSDTEEEMKALLDANLKVWNTGNVSLFDKILSPEVVLHPNESENLIGIEANKEWVTSTRTGFPDFKVTFDKIIIKGEYAAVGWTSTGTNTGTFLGLPPTGKKVNFSGAFIMHAVNGKAIEIWQHWDGSSLLIQLGYIISPPEE